MNDDHGHGTGDAVLKRFAEKAQGTLRTTDILGRTGGEEFALVLPDAARSSAVAVAEKLRTAIEADFVPGMPPTITVSIGVATIGQGGTTIQSALEEADSALYQARRTGRIRVVAAGSF